jgi:hypothetical protein
LLGDFWRGACRGRGAGGERAVWGGGRDCLVASKER